MFSQPRTPWAAATTAALRTAAHAPLDDGGGDDDDGDQEPFLLNFFLPNNLMNSEISFEMELHIYWQKLVCK